MATRIVRRSTARDFCRVLFRRQRLMLWFFVATMALVTLVLVIMPRTYMSESRLFVRLGKESVGLDPTVTTSQTVPMENSRESEINSELEILRSRVLREDVVKKIGADVVLRETPNGESTWFSTLMTPISATINLLSQSGSLSPDERAVSKLEKTLTCTSPKKSNVIIVKCKARDPRLAQQIVDTFVDAYLLRHAKANRTVGSHEFFVEQSDKLHEELAKTNEELRAAKNKIGLLSIDGQRENIQTQINGLEGAKLENTRALAASTAKVNSLKATLAGLPKELEAEQVSGLPNVAGDAMRNELYKLQIDEKEASSRLTADHPRVQALRRQVAETEAILDKQDPRRSQTTRKLNPVYQETQRDLLVAEALQASEQAEAKSLETQLAAVHTKLKDLNDSQERINTLVRRTELLEASYREYANNREQARIDDALEADKISNVNVVQTASFVAKPTSPRVGLTLAGGLVLGVLGAVMLAFAVEHFDRSVKTPEEVERELGLPVLLSVPRISARHYLHN